MDYAGKICGDPAGIDPATESPQGVLSLRTGPSGSVKEGKVCHGARLRLRIHEDAVPGVQRDDLVIGMTNGAAGVDAGVAPHAVDLWPGIRGSVIGCNGPSLWPCTERRAA